MRMTASEIFVSFAASAALLLIVISAAIPASAAQVLLMGRGTNPDTGIMSVTYSVNGALTKVSRADLEAAGVDIFNLEQVASHIGANGRAADWGGQRTIMLGPDGILGTADDYTDGGDRW